MAPNFILHYFNQKAVGEGCRLLFAAAGVEYEDKRYEQETTWPQFKPKTPFGKLPVLEVDGQMIPQSRSIERFLAKKFGFYGKTQMEETRIDVHIDTITEIMDPMGPIFSEKDETRRAGLKKEYEEKTLPDTLAKLEKYTGDSGYMVGKELTWADTAFYHFTELPPALGIAMSLDKHPKLSKVVTNVKNNPGIAAWLQKRPKTQF